MFLEGHSAKGENLSELSLPGGGNLEKTSFMNRTSHSHDARTNRSALTVCVCNFAFDKTLLQFLSTFIYMICLLFVVFASFLCESTLIMTDNAFGRDIAFVLAVH